MPVSSPLSDYLESPDIGAGRAGSRLRLALESVYRGINGKMGGVTLRQFSLATGVLVAYGLAVGAYVLIPQTSTSAPLLLRAVLVLAPLVAGSTCVAAVRALPPVAVIPWSLLAAAGGTATIAAGLVSGPAAISTGLHTAWLLTLLGSYLLFALACLWMIHQRDSGRRREIAMDSALTVIGASAAILWWAPGAQAVVADPRSFHPLIAFVQIAIPVVALCAMILCSVLLLSRRGTASENSAAAITGGAALLGLVALPFVLGDPPCCPVGKPYAIARIGGWAFLAYAGARVIGGGAASFASSGIEAGGTRFRQTAAPLLALLTAVIIIDGTLRPPLSLAVAVTLAVGCVLLGCRAGQLLAVSLRVSAERRELKQTRALIEVSRALSGKTELDTTLEVVTQWTCQLLGAQAAVIELLSEDGQTLELRAASGLPAEAIGLYFPVDNSFTGWVVRNGKARATTDPRRESDISEASRPFVGKSPTAAAPLRYANRTLGVLACVAPRPFDLSDFELLGALADQAALAIENARLFKQVDRMSKTDPLTGLSNRRQLELDLAREFAAAQRGRKLVAVMFDINEFKAHNDRFGHIAGDEALRLFAEVLAAETRAINPPARYGGDEFVALLTETDTQGALLFTERVRESFSNAVANTRRRTLSVSAGFAEFTPEMRSPDDLIDAADRALYEAKANKPKEELPAASA